MKREQIVVGNYTYPYYSFDYFLDSMQRMEVERIELWAAEPHLYYADRSIAETKALAGKIRDRGIKVVCVTPEQYLYPINIGASDDNARRRSVDFFLRTVETAVIMEAPYAFITSGHQLHDESREACFERCVESLGELADYAARNGVTFCFEGLPRKVDIARTAPEIGRLLDAVDRYDALRPMWDVDVAYRLGDSCRDYLDAFGGGLAYVHFVDTRHTAPGDGEMPLVQFLEELDAAGYAGPLSLEINNDRYLDDPDPAIERSLRFFEAYMRTH